MAIKLTERFSATTAGNVSLGPPDMASLSGGGFAVGWTRDDENQAIAGRLFDPNGRQGNPFTVDGAGDVAQEPVLTGLDDGGFGVAWENQSGSLFSSPAIRGNLITASGAVSTQFTVDADAAGGEEDPALTTLAGGNLALAWTAQDNPSLDSETSTIQADIRTASGEQLQRISIPDPGDDGLLFPEVAALNDGNFALAWSDQGLSNQVRGHIYTADGQRETTLTLTGGEADAEQLSHQITGLADGGFAATWTSQPKGVIRGNLFTSAGERTAEFSITDVANDSLRPTVTSLSDGKFVVAWAEQGGAFGEGPVEDFIRGKVFTSAGTPIETFQVTGRGDNEQAKPSLAALSDGDFAVAWQDLQASSTVQGNVFSVTPDGESGGQGNGLAAPATGFVPAHTAFDEILDVSATNASDLRLFGTGEGEIGTGSGAFVGQNFNEGRNGFFPVEALGGLTAEQGKYFFKTFTPDAGTSDWQRFNVTETASERTSLVGVAQRALPADETVPLDEIIDTSRLADGAQVQVFFEGRNFGFLTPDELSQESLTLPGDGQTANLWLNQFLSGEDSRSGWSRTELVASDEAAIEALASGDALAASDPLGGAA